MPILIFFGTVELVGRPTTRHSFVTLMRPIVNYKFNDCNKIMKYL